MNRNRYFACKATNAPVGNYLLTVTPERAAYISAKAKIESENLGFSSVDDPIQRWAYSYLLNMYGDSNHRIFDFHELPQNLGDRTRLAIAQGYQPT